MAFVILETGALILTILIGMEMRRQNVPWRSVAIRLLIVGVVLTAMILMWRGL